MPTAKAVANEEERNAMKKILTLIVLAAALAAGTAIAANYFSGSAAYAGCDGGC
jgi:hypothetical protein